MLWGIPCHSLFPIGNLSTESVLSANCCMILQKFFACYTSRLGRRRSLALFMTAAAIFFVSLALFDVFESLENHELVLICLCLLGKLWVSGARGCVRTITGESYPTSIRGMGACICGVSNGIGAALAPQLAFLGSRKYILFALTLTCHDLCVAEI